MQAHDVGPDGEKGTRWGSHPQPLGRQGPGFGEEGFPWTQDEGTFGDDSSMLHLLCPLFAPS